jgi:hypothetical protein
MDDGPYSRLIGLRVTVSIEAIMFASSRNLPRGFS